MDPFHFQILCDVGLWCLLSLAVMIPFYALLRGKGLQGNWAGLGLVRVDGFRWFDLIGVLGLFLLLGGSVLLAGKKGGAPMTQLPSVSMILTPGLTFIFLAFIAHATLLSRVNLVELFGLRAHWGRIVVVAVVSVILVYAVLIGLDLLGFEQWMAERVGEKEEQLAVKMLRADGSEAQKLAMVIAACLLAPVAEEFLFRGYIYPILKKYSEPYAAAVLSGVFFGLVHGHVWVLIPLSIFGVILALAYEWSGSIWAPILGHTIFNSLTVLVIFQDAG